MKPHKHKDLIIAWANGADLQYEFEGKWHDFSAMPSWRDDINYRIKPEQKPDVFYYCNASSAQGFVYISGHKDGRCQTTPHNLKLTFDGETRKLKSAEVIS